MNDFENHTAAWLRPILYSKLDHMGVEDLTNATIDLSKRLAQEIESCCMEAARRGPDWRVAVSPLEREGFSFIHKFAFIEGPWISPEFSGWMIYAPFPAQGIVTEGGDAPAAPVSAAN